MSWHQELLVGFDLETTGTDVEQDRIVTAALIRLEGDGRTAAQQTWLLDPGVPIPGEAAAIHGISTAYVREHGRPPATAIEEITEALADALRADIPLVVMNARYDLSLLDRECRRHGLRTLTERLGHAPAPVIDPLVLDKHVDRYRKGKRALQALCGHYGVPLDGAHEAGADAAAAAGVARRIGETFPAVALPSPRALHALQEQAAAEQAASFQAYLRRSGDPRAIVEPAWPLIPYQAGA
ncbi:exonuclease domain-containing protein [Streptomyces angustmyceticus]|uniref:3'-5' exonuclease n=1 Tax=Streptomyces angustmyceticus TaxID=285578 RepID=A0A5J4LD85_9ACTN|nr:exonuclease domain-containing protein [Streptomyces angustmyceticus]UAL66544.1 3'-5' exonuclease [Streptomyces angustmyceticus]GES28618.1 3'-5' exonuclease [Streptomyces angustmyceticus]